MTMRKIEPKTDSYMSGELVGGPSKSKKEAPKIYPHLRLEHQFFPESKKWEVGKEYTIELKLKMTGLSISKYQNDSEFDIIGVDAESSSDKDDK